MLVVVVMVALKSSLVDTSLLHRLCRGVGDWHHLHKISRSIERIIDVLHLKAGDALKRCIVQIICTARLT